MADLKKNFLKGIMNKDNDEIVLPEGTIRDGLNIDIVHSEGDDSGLVRNKKGNTLIGDLSSTAGQLIQNCRTIGATSSETDNLLYYFIASDKFDGIYEFNESTGLIHRILQSNKSTPSTPSKLNFNQSHYITGVNFVDGFLYWTDDYNPPRRINISRSRAYSVDDDRIDLDIDVILAPPLHAPTIELKKEENQENNMKEKFLQFSHRYKYIDNQYSAMSPWSGVAFAPDDFELDFGAGENKAMLNTKNKVDISFSTGNQFVEEVELLVRDTKSSNVSIVEIFNKKQLDIESNSIFKYTFANNKTYRTLSVNQLTRLFDNVPLKAKAQEFIDRRIIYGNYEQSYDIVDSLGKDIAIDYVVKCVSKETPEKTPIQTFRSDRELEIGLQYGDDYGRFSTILTSPVSSSTVYIPPQNSIYGNSLVVDINNKPPEFAKYFRLSVKQVKGDYYNIFPVLYYADGSHRYFLVNDFDKDKIRVGEYVIFKSDLEGPTLKNKRYKILEFEAKPADFLGYNSTTEAEGLYFKIKVNSTNEFNPSSLSSYAHNSTGTNYLNSGGHALICPVYQKFSVAEKPIHYGDGEADILSVINNAYPGSWTGDKRITVRIISQTELEYTSQLSGSSGWVTASLVPNISIPIIIGGATMCSISFLYQSFYTVGDVWKINCRSDGHFKGNVFGGIGIPTDGTPMSAGDWGGACVLLNDAWSPTSSPLTDRRIEAYAIITIRITSDSENPPYQPVQQFQPTTTSYENIEEWFIESGAYTSFIFNENLSTGGSSVNNVGAKAVTFRRGHMYDSTQYNFSNSHFAWIEQGGSITTDTLNYPVRMIIQGFGYDNSNWNEISASISIQQSESSTQCETLPEENDIDIFHETTRTYKVVNGLHKVLWDYQDFTFPSYATIDTVAYTNLGQLIPGTAPDGMEPHTFQVGDQVQVHTSTSPYASIPGTHTVVHVEDSYNIVIDLLAPGAGATTAGSIGFYHDEMEESDQDALGSTAKILINPTTNSNSTFNAYAFGNGLESDRIRDNFNSTTLEYSPRASTTIEGYGRERKESSLTYGGTYRDSTSTNGLNEFNYSLVNFKNLDIEFGSVQKLYARDTDLVVFQEDKVSKVLYGKNLWSDAVGDGTIGITPEVLGTQIADKGEWGISFNPESFAQWGSDLYWTDARRGAVLSMGNQGIVPISDYGMTSHFRDLMREDVNTQKIGVFDPYNKHYIIAANDNTSRPCELKLNRYGQNYPSNISDWPGVISKYGEDFIIMSNSSWTAEIVYSSGSGWVKGCPLSGSGTENVFLTLENNTTLVVRTATITFTYCDGATAVFTVTQAAGPKLTVHPWVLINKK